jgi:short-subunit dehydrogenase
MQHSENFALITGATSGIGYELAKLFAQDNYNLVLVARSRKELDKAETELRALGAPTIITMNKDLFERENAFDVYEEIRSRGIQVDVLVNDAGQGEYGEFVDTDIDRELDIIELNIISVLVLTKQFLKEMVARGNGRILNVASIAGKLPGPLQAVYHGTKAFVHSFTEAIRNEVKDTGVTVTSLLPGPTDTGFFEKAGMEDAKNVKEGSLANPADVAKDGYEALMKGDDMVVSGMKNKLQVAMSNITPDSAVAEKVHKQQEPSHK